MLIVILGTFSKEKNQTCSKDTQQIVFFVIVVVVVLLNSGPGAAQKSVLERQVPGGMEKLL